MRGIRVNLSGPQEKDAVYLGMETLAMLQGALKEIGEEVARERLDHSSREGLAPAGTAYVGACALRSVDGMPKVHTLNVAYYFAPQSSGMALSAFRNVEFRFPNQDPSQLSAVLSRALDQLRDRE
jgi:hypothetical protein